MTIAKTLAVLALILAGTDADKPFVSGGAINMQLESGEYDIVPAKDNHIRVTLGGNIGSTVVEVTTANTQASVKVSKTPNHGNFHATIEVPKTSDITIRMTAGDLEVGDITGSKDVSLRAGDLKIAAGNPDNYASVDASVTIGDLSGGPFKVNGSFLSHSAKWTGKGKYTLKARVMTGDLKID